ncbi:PASTA domain-containing protein [bacterium]|nr:PASTA domain-containing protein [bacterium]
MKNQKIRILIFFVIIFSLFGGIIFRLGYLQLLQNKKMAKLAISNYLKKESIDLERGIIYDRNMKELVVSIETDSLYAHPQKVILKDQVAALLSPLLEMPKEEILEKLYKDSPFVWLKRKLNKDIPKKIEQLNLNGLGFIKEYKRFYPKQELASQLIGFVGLDNQGLEGIELYFDQQLRETGKKVEITKDALGRAISLKKGLPQVFSGFNMVLTIEEVFQNICEEELKEICKNSQAISGTIIIMDPKNGEILSLANYPSFNPNYAANSSSCLWRNRAITDTFEPGSTFKIFTAATVLINRVVTSHDFFECQGNTEIAGRKIRCHESHGRLTFEEVIANSCNVGTIKSAMRLNKYDFYHCLKKFGFNNYTGINLPGERKGILLPPRRWSKLTLANFAIGQGITTTAIQLTAAVCSVANGGFLMKPLIVKKIINSRNEIIKEYQPTCIRRTIPPNVVKYLTSILQKAVSEGTGKKAKVMDYPIAGKTGTAQKVDPVTGTYTRNKFLASFIGYLPADNPRLLISIFINEPKGLYYGGEVAAPVFRKIVEKILAYKKPYFLDKDPSYEYVRATKDNLSSLREKDNLPLINDSLNEYIMPDVHGKSMRMAWKILSSYQVKLKFYGRGVVESSIPNSGEKLVPGQEIKIWCSPKI